MDIQKKTRNDERRILIAMIVDPIVLGRISIKWDKRGLFKNKWSNLIGRWCVDHYKTYGKAPMGWIENRYESWAAKNRDETTINLVEKFLKTLSDDYESLRDESNSDYIIDLAGQYFNQVKIERLLQTVQETIDTGDVENAHNEILAYNKIELGVGEGIDALQDEEAIKAAFVDKKEPLIKYPGDLGKFINKALERDAFISFLAPEKRGKSWMLLDVAYRAVQQKRRVAFFECGDMSQSQILRRLMIRVSRRPFGRQRKDLLIKYPEKLIVTPQLKADGSTKHSVQVEHKIKRFKKGLNQKIAWKACKKIVEEKLKSSDTLFRLSCHPNSSLSVNKMKEILHNWERQGWVPDVIVIDYADILNMDYHHLEGRDRINETWKQLRGLSQTYHCLLVTATQSDAASYEASTLKQKNFSEDKRKLAHVTGMIGINTTDEEKEQGVVRLNWVVLRESEFNTNDCVFLAQCLKIGNPTVKSSF